WRDPSVIVTGGVSAAGVGRANPTSDRPARIILADMVPPCEFARPRRAALPPQYQVRSRPDQSIPILERPRLPLLSLADLRTEDDVLPRSEIQPGGHRGVESLEAGAIAVHVVKELDARDGVQAWCHRVRQVVDEREPRNVAEVGYIRLIAEQGVERVRK